MIRGVWGWKCRADPLIAVHRSPACLRSVKAMESSSSARTPKHPRHSQPPQRNYGKVVDGTSLRSPMEGADDHERRSSDVGGVATNTASPVLKTNAGKPKRGSFGGAGSSLQNLSFSPSIADAAGTPDIIFGTVDFRANDLNVPNSHSDFPPLSDNVDQAQVSSVQPVTQSWDEPQVDNSDQAKDLSSAGVVEFEAPMPLEEKRPSEPDLGLGLSVSGWAGQSKDIAPASQSPLIDDSQFPSLSASSATVTKRKPWGKGGRGSTEQAQTAQAHLSSRSQEPRQRSEGNGQGGWDKVGQANIVQTRHSGNYDGRKDVEPGFESGGGRRGGRQGGELRDSRQGREQRDGGWQGVEQRHDRKDGDWQGGGQRHDRRDGWQGGERRNGRQGNEWRDDGKDVQWRDDPRDKQSAIESLGRLLTRILRHQALELNLKMGKDGFVDVQDLLKLSTRTRSNRALSSHSVDDVKQVVEQDNKSRLGIVEENGRLFIRANQGHTIQSVESDHLLKRIISADEVPVCVHGTYRQYLASIFKGGLKRQTRNHVHFATGQFGEGSVISGMRSTVDVLIYLNVKKALADGMIIYISENGVILTEGFDGVVPVDYFGEVLGLPGLKPIVVPSRVPSK